MFVNIFIDKVNHMTNPFFESIFSTDSIGNTVMDVLSLGAYNMLS
jgi:hypothetical protein